MNKEQRAAMANRRQLMQLRLQRAAAARQFRALAPLLCAQGVRFAKLPPVACAQALSHLANAPLQDERLAWAHVAGAVCQPWSSEAERDDLIIAALAALAAPAEKIAVIWHPAEAGLRIESCKLQSVIARVFADLRETIWLVAADGGPWVIEVSQPDRELCWAIAL